MNAPSLLKAVESPVVASHLPATSRSAAVTLHREAGHGRERCVVDGCFFILREVSAGDQNELAALPEVRVAAVVAEVSRRSRREDKMRVGFDLDRVDVSAGRLGYGEEVGEFIGGDEVSSESDRCFAGLDLLAGEQTALWDSPVGT